MVDQEQIDNWEDQLPEWAEMKAHGNYKHIRAALPTRDGRKTGNAVNAGVHRNPDHLLPTVYYVVTDAGNIIRATENEMKELFHPPEYVMKHFLPAHIEALNMEKQ